MNRNIAILSITHLAALLVGFLLVSVRPVETASSKKNESHINHLRINLPIFVAESNKDLNLLIAKRLNKIMGREGYDIHESKNNRGCAFWVSSAEFAFKGPPIEGYLIIINDSSAEFYFSSEATGMKGLDHLERAVLKDNEGIPYLPEGIMTDLRVNNKR